MLGMTQMNILAAATGISPALNQPELALAEYAVLGKGMLLESVVRRECEIPIRMYLESSCQ